MAELVLTMERMLSRLATTGLVVAASLKVQAILGVLLLPVRGARQGDELYTPGKVASWSRRATGLRSELVIPLVGFSRLIKLSWFHLAIQSTIQSWCRHSLGLIRPIHHLTLTYWCTPDLLGATRQSLQNVLGGFSSWIKVCSNAQCLDRTHWTGTLSKG